MEVPLHLNFVSHMIYDSDDSSMMIINKYKSIIKNNNSQAIFIIETLIGMSRVSMNEEHYFEENLIIVKSIRRFTDNGDE